MEGPEESEFLKLARQAFTGAAKSLILKAHGCAMERFGTDLDQHLRAADLLLRQRADHLVITAALLAPLRKQRLIQFDEARARFGVVPAVLAERAFSQEPLRFDTEHHHREDLKVFLESLGQDLRGTVLSLGLRLAELERLAEREGDAHHAIARETLELYVPLADRMGMKVLRKRFEDTCFRILEPLLYEELARKVEPIQAEDRTCLFLLQAGVKRLLAENKTEGRVQGRTKSLYSIYRKMRRLKVPLEQILDRIGLRVIVSSTDECYAVSRLLHQHFRPVPGTLDDYIAFPKANGYRSLHTCVYPVPDISYKPVEFQIRTEQMHQEAEYGIAAHWMYKGDQEAWPDGETRLGWLRTLLDQRQESVDHAAFVQQLHKQVFADRLLVFGEDGQAVRLPVGAAVDDLEWIQRPE
jgi:GTP pyrophosphokinase